jgi:hypothetical protein
MDTAVLKLFLRCIDTMVVVDLEKQIFGENERSIPGGSTNGVPQAMIGVARKIGTAIASLLHGTDLASQTVQSHVVLPSTHCTPTEIENVS